MSTLQEKYFKTRFPRASRYEREKIMADWRHKEKKAEGLFYDFVDRAGDVRGKKILEIGFGNGLNLAPFVRAGAKAYGIEVDDLLLEIAQENFRERSLQAELSLYDGERIPFDDNYFDYLYATSVLEHVSNLSAVLKESARVLKPGGRFYVSFPNRLWPKETHSGIWGANYLPRPLVRFLFKIFGRSSLEDWNLHFLSYWTLQRVLRRHSIPLSVIFETESENGLKKALKKILARLGVHHSAILRTVMVVLEKHENSQHTA